MEDIPYILHSFKTVMPTWKSVLDFAQSNPHVPDALRPEWKEAIGSIRGELGEGFFKTCGNWHPVYLMLNQGAEGQVRSMIRWVDTLRHFKSHTKTYPLLLEKLVIKAKTRAEGMPFMDIAKRHREQGFLVEFPSEDQDAKNADIEMVFTPTGEKILIEVSRLGNSKPRADDIDQYNKLFNVIHKYGYDLPFAGQIKSLMSEKTLLETANEIVHLKYRAWETKSVAAFIDENIAIAFCTDSSYGQLTEWCAANNVSEGYSGMPLDFNDTQRIIRTQRINREAKQIASDQSGLLYFPVQWLYMLKMDIAESIEQFSLALTKHSNVIGMVLVAEVGVGLQPDCHIEAGHLYCVSRDQAGICRHILFIENPGFTGSVSDELKASLKKAMVNPVKEKHCITIGSQTINL